MRAVAPLTAVLGQSPCRAHESILAEQAPGDRWQDLHRVFRQRSKVLGNPPQSSASSLSRAGTLKITSTAGLSKAGLSSKACMPQMQPITPQAQHHPYHHRLQHRYSNSSSCACRCASAWLKAPQDNASIALLTLYVHLRRLKVHASSGGMTARISSPWSRATSGTSSCCSTPLLHCARYHQHSLLWDI